MADTTRPQLDSGAAKPIFGRAVGRYLLLDPIGRGGCGEVFGAFDPMLDRKVAIKLLHRRSVSDAEIVQEGRILARFSHPNVLPVFDVGVEQGQAFLAMEYAPGGDLRRWLDEEAPHDALRALVGVAMGLAAAHEAGIVHGDIKPANVLIGDDGRLRISDFGIARSATLRSYGSTDPEIAGTPAYMAPEQASGGASPFSDQYSFCIMASEVLRSIRLPARTTAALERGSADDPDARWPSMRALALALGRQPSRRPWAIAAVAALAVAGGLGAANSHSADPCTRARETARSTWDGTARTDVETAVKNGGAPEAERTWTRTDASLNAYVDALGQMRVELCRAGEEGHLAPDDRKAKATCLDRAQFHVGAVVRQLKTATDRTDRLLHGLPDLGRCVSPDEALPPDDVAAQVAALNEQITEVDVLLNAGRVADAAETFEPIRAAASASGHAPLEVRALLAEAWVLQASDRDDEAAPILERGLSGAIEHGLERHAFRAATGLGYLLGQRLERHDVGLAYAKLGVSYATSLGSSPADEANARTNLAAVLSARGNTESALAEARRVLALRTEAFGPTDGRVATAHADLSIDLRVMGLLEEAETHRRKALELRVAVFGETHPATLRTQTNLATLLAQMGKVVEGEQLARQVLAARSLDGSANAYDRMMALMALAHALSEQKRPGEAADAYHRVLELAEPDRRRHNALAAAALGNLAIAQGDLEQFEEAEQTYARAIEMKTASLGEKHPRIASTRVARAANLLDLGRVDEAEAQATLAVEALESTDGASPQALAAAKAALAEVHAAQDG